MRAHASRHIQIHFRTTHLWIALDVGPFIDYMHLQRAILVLGSTIHHQHLDVSASTRRARCWPVGRPRESRSFSRPSRGLLIEVVVGASTGELEEHVAEHRIIAGRSGGARWPVGRRHQRMCLLLLPRRARPIVVEGLPAVEAAGAAIAASWAAPRLARLALREPSTVLPRVPDPPTRYNYLLGGVATTPQTIQ